MLRLQTGKGQARGEGRLSGTEQELKVNRNNTVSFELVVLIRSTNLAKECVALSLDSSKGNLPKGLTIFHFSLNISKLPY